MFTTSREKLKAVTLILNGKDNQQILKALSNGVTTGDLNVMRFQIKKGKCNVSVNIADLPRRELMKLVEMV